MNRIPSDRYLSCDSLSLYITPPLFMEFHDDEERESFSVWIQNHHARLAIDPDGEFAYSAIDYEKWLESL